MVIGLIFHCTDLPAGSPLISAEQISENLDSSKTFIHPRIPRAAESLGIRQGIPGACRLFGMDGYLKSYVVWSTDLKKAVRVNDDGTVDGVATAHYVEAMTCTVRQPYLPGITLESMEKNPDGSVTLSLPQIHNGPEHFPILSGHAGVCRLLGYGEPVEHSREWSTRTTEGVSLAADGQIYEKASGTFLTVLACMSESQKRGRWAGKRRTTPKSLRSR